jgi:UDP-glucose 4-epimerase
MIDEGWRAAFAAGHEVLDLNAFVGEAGGRAIERARSIIYLAARSTPVSSADLPSVEFTENLKSAFETFTRINRINPSARILLLSSGGTVYGDTTLSPIPEDHPLRPISPYGLGKVLMEQTLTFFSTARGQPVTILRVSNLVGRHFRPRYMGLVAATLRAILQRTAIPVFGDGMHVRDFIDADDAADAILRVAENENDPYCLWNLGSGRGHTIMRTIELAGQIAGEVPPIEWRPARPFDVRSSVLDVSRIKREIGWAPETPLRRSIEKVFESMTSAVRT